MTFCSCIDEKKKKEKIVKQFSMRPKCENTFKRNDIKQNLSTQIETTCVCFFLQSKHDTLCCK